MKDAILRFATLNAENVIPYVYIGMAVVWIIMVATAFFSLRAQPIGAGAKMVWALLIVLLPIVGMTLYCLRCLLRADYPLLEQLGFFGKSRVAAAMTSSSRQP
jgi:hypothetical protein